MIQNLIFNKQKLIHQIVCLHCLDCEDNLNIMWEKKFKVIQLFSSVAHPQLPDGQQLPAQISENAEASGSSSFPD